MAKKKISYGFSKFRLSKDKNTYLIEEVSKDSIEIYNLTQILDELIDKENLSMSISNEDIVPTFDE